MSSYVVLPSEKVRELCTKKLEWCSVEYRKFIEIAIDVRVESSKNSWFRRIFRLPIITREQAEAGFDNDFLGTLHIASLIVQPEKSTASRLLVAAGAAEEVNVSVDDLETIS